MAQGNQNTYIFISTSAFDAIKSKGVLMKIADSRVSEVASLILTYLFLLQPSRP